MSSYTNNCVVSMVKTLCVLEINKLLKNKTGSEISQVSYNRFTVSDVLACVKEQKRKFKLHSGKVRHFWQTIETTHLQLKCFKVHLNWDLSVFLRWNMFLLIFPQNAAHARKGYGPSRQFHQEWNSCRDKVGYCLYSENAWSETNQRCW